MCSPEELIRNGRRMAELGLVVGSLGNLSCRQGENILITPTGMEYYTIKPQDMVTLHLGGRKLAGRREASSEFRMHLAIYRVQAQARAIVHTHSSHGLALSLVAKELPALTEELELLAGGSVPVAPFSPAGTPQLAEGAAKHLGKTRKAVILARHGVVGVGKDLSEAFLICQLVERTARIYFLTRGITPPSPSA